MTTALSQVVPVSQLRHRTAFTIIQHFFFEIMSKICRNVWFLLLNFQFVNIFDALHRCNVVSNSPVEKLNNRFSVIPTSSDSNQICGQSRVSNVGLGTLVTSWPLRSLWRSLCRDDAQLDTHGHQRCLLELALPSETLQLERRPLKKRKIMRKKQMCSKVLRLFAVSLLVAIDLRSVRHAWSSA